MKAQLERKRQLDHCDRSRGQVLRLKDADVVPKHIEVVEEADEPPLALDSGALRGEGRFLEGHCRAGVEDVVDGLVPRVVAKAVEEPPMGKPQSLKSCSRHGSLRHCQKWLYFFVTRRSSMRENSQEKVSISSNGSTRDPEGSFGSNA